MRFRLRLMFGFIVMADVVDVLNPERWRANICDWRITESINKYRCCPRTARFMRSVLVKNGEMTPRAIYLYEKLARFILVEFSLRPLWLRCNEDPYHCRNARRPVLNLHSASLVRRKNFIFLKIKRHKTNHRPIVRLCLLITSRSDVNKSFWLLGSNS